MKLRHELMSLLVAGRDTAAALLTNLWWEIARRPDVWTSLQSEIAFLGTRPPTYDELKSMKYLIATVKEALRLYPPLPANSRQALEDTILPTGGGPDQKSPILMRKDWILHWHLWTMHRRKDFFGEDAAEFRPSRWLDQPDGTKGLRPGWEYLPFNGGPRICIARTILPTNSMFDPLADRHSYRAIWPSRGVLRHSPAAAGIRRRNRTARL